MTDAAAGQLPLDRQAGVARMEELARGARGVEEIVASITGRWPRVRLLHQYQLAQVDDPPLALLQTSGPVLGRSLELADPAARNATQGDPPPVVAISTELVVVGRLPAAVAAELPMTGDPLDRLLDRFAVDWDSELLHTHLIPDQTTWVQVLRRIWSGAEIVALLSDEYQVHPGLLTDQHADGAAESTP